MRKIERGIWPTKTGRVIEIAKMTKSHLKHAIDMMKRNGFVSYSTLSFFCSCSPPTAEYTVDQFERIKEEIFSHVPSYKLDELEKEYEERINTDDN